MNYRSNLVAPDLSPNFAHLLRRPLPYSLGHEVLSDWADKPTHDPVYGLQRGCGFLTLDEAAILHSIVRLVPGGPWVDIGCHTGWTSSYLADAGAAVTAIDPQLHNIEFEQRFRMNTRPYAELIWHIIGTSDYFFRDLPAYVRYRGFMIDGNHDSPCPVNDARNALAHLAPTGAIVFHDFWGRPIREGVEYLMAQGLSCRIYDTPAGMAVCSYGTFTPPLHHPDPAIDWARIRRERAPEFNFGATHFGAAL